MSYRWTWRTRLGMTAVQSLIWGLGALVLTAAGRVLGIDSASWWWVAAAPAAAVAVGLFGWVADSVIWYVIDHYAPKKCPHCGKRMDQVERV